MTIQEFIELHKLTLSFVRINVRTDRTGNEWDKEAFHYLVTIVGNDEEKAYTFQYSMGSAHVEKIPYGKLTIGQRFMAGLTRGQKDYDNVPPPHVKRSISLWQAEAQKVLYKPKPPQLAEVLDSVALDCSSIDNARDFEDWASEFGYDTDSRKAEKAYDTCRDAFKSMESLLGRDGLRTLMNDVERI